MGRDSPLSFGYVHPLDRGSQIGSALGAVQQSGKVGLQVLFVLGDGLPVHSRRALSPHPVEGFGQPLDIQIVVERCQPLLRSLTSYFRYPLLFGVHVLRSLCIFHVSQQRFRIRAAAFPTPRLPRRSRFAGFICGTMPPLRLPPRFLRRSVRHIATDYPGSAWLFRSLRRASLLPQGLEVVKPVHPSRRLVPRTRTGLPCSQGTLLCLCPALRPRPDLAPGLSGAAVLFPPI